MDEGFGVGGLVVMVGGGRRRRRGAGVGDGRVFFGGFGGAGAVVHGRGVLGCVLRCGMSCVGIGGIGTAGNAGAVGIGGACGKGGGGGILANGRHFAFLD